MTTSPSSLLIITVFCGFLTGFSMLPVQAAESADVKHRADQSFDHLSQQPESKSDRQSSAIVPATGENGIGGYSSEKYWIGKGQGDLTKGNIVCQRVSELSARTDLAKQIRVMVKEHMVDRVRDRRGREPEQDIELTREEIVQEYLQDVRIVDHRINEDNKTCHATAVMPRTPLQPRPQLDIDMPAPSPSKR